MNLLNDHQARAVYDAMCALNNVDGRIHARINAKGKAILVIQYEDETIEISRDDWAKDMNAQYGVNRFENQNHFASVYGLDRA